MANTETQSDVDRTLRSARREARRARVLEAALRVLTTRGYTDTSVDAVVAEARASKTTFYEFFDSKEECVRELLVREGGSLIHAVNLAAAAGEDPRDRMRRGIRAFVHTCNQRWGVARVLLVESVGASERIEEVRRELQGRFASVVEELARTARLRGDEFYASVDPAVFGWAVVGAVGEATAHLLSREAVTAESLADGLCAIFAPLPPA